MISFYNKLLLAISRKGSLVLFLLITANVFSQENFSLHASLNNIPGLEISKMKTGDTFTEKYEVFISQPLDHADPEAGSFRQRFFVCHKNIEAPVVLVTEGYAADYAERPDYQSEAGFLLDANEIVVEHRYFSKSRPDNPDWTYLTVANAAADHHRIVKLMKTVYEGKWLSTGISKGGQTAMFHRTLYPGDVDATLAYVAPLNFSDEDLRVYEFLENVGDPACRKLIFDFQKRVLENREESLEAFEELAKIKKLTYSVGLEEAFELMVLEYSFAFWQWGLTPCEADFIPGEGTNAEDWMDHIDRVAGIDWVSDQGIERVHPFFYQALTEIGMYGYDLEPFGELIEALDDNTFAFTCPEGVDCTFNPETMRIVDHYVRHEATNLMLVYGEWDAWSSTAVQWSGNRGVVKIVKPFGSHFTRIGNLPEGLKERTIETLKMWMEN